MRKDLLCVSLGRGHDARVEDEEVEPRLCAAHGFGEGLNGCEVGEVEGEHGDVGVGDGVAACFRALHGVYHGSLCCLHVAAAEEDAAAGGGERLDGLETDSRVSPAARVVSSRGRDCLGSQA